MKAAEILLKSTLFLHWKNYKHPCIQKWHSYLSTHQELKLIKETLKLSKWSKQAEKHQR